MGVDTGYSLVSIYQTDAFDQFLKLFLFEFFKLLIGLEFGLPFRLGVRVGVGFGLVT